MKIQDQELAVLTFPGVHVSRFDDIDRGSDAGGDETSDKRRQGVARKVV